MYNPVVMALLLLLFVSGCEDGKNGFRSVEFEVAPHIKIDPAELKNMPLAVKTDESESRTLRVVIYSYSSGKEIITMGEGGFKTDTGSGSIKALVELIDGGRVVRAGFIEVSGSSREELLENLAKSLGAMTGN